MRIISRLLIVLSLVVGLLLPQPIAAAPAPEENFQTEGNDLAQRFAELQRQPPSMYERFDDDTQGWLIEPEDDERTFAIVDGRYHIKLLSADDFAWVSSDIPDGGDFALTVETSRVGGPLANEFGVIFHYQDFDNFTCFVVSGDGWFALYRFHNGDLQWLVPWTESDAIVTGEGSVNQLGVLVERPLIAILVNGEVVATVEDESAVEGTLGLTVGSYEEGNVEIAFSDLKLWSPLPAAATSSSAPISINVAMETIHNQEPTFAESFRRDQGRWQVGTDEGVSRSIQGRAYHLSIAEPDRTAWSSANLALGDFLAEVDLIRLAGSAKSEAGLLFGYQASDNYCQFNLDGAGNYQSGCWNGGQFQALAAGSAVDLLAAEAEAINHLGVLVLDGQVSFLVNDQILAQVPATVPTGDLALAAKTRGEGGLEVVFDDLEVWDLSELDLELATIQASPMPALDTQTAVDEILAAIWAAPPLMSELFNRDTGRWNVSTTEESATFYQARAFHIRNMAPQSLSWTPVPDFNGYDFLVEVDATHVAGAVEMNAAQAANSIDEYGFIFRRQDANNFYYFSVNVAGSFQLYKKIAGTWQAIIPWTKATAIQHANATNRLSVLAQGQNLVVMANGQVLAAVQDASFSAGGIALAAGSGDEPNAEIAFDDLELWDLAAVEIQVPAIILVEDATATPVPTSPPAPTPTPLPTPTPRPTATLRPTPTPAPLSLDEVWIDWGVLPSAFDIGNVTVESRMGTELGMPMRYDAMIFDVEATIPVFYVMVYAHFLTDTGTEIGMMPVMFEPFPTYGWYVGMRSQGVIMLPPRELQSEIDQIVILEY